MKYLVIQEPKSEWRRALVVGFVVVNANSKASAVRLASSDLCAATGFKKLYALEFREHNYYRV